MSKEKNKKNLKNQIGDSTKAAAWLVEAAFRTTVGIVIFQKTTGVVFTAIALYALATAGLILISHFVKAYK